MITRRRVIAAAGAGAAGIVAARLALPRVLRPGAPRPFTGALAEWAAEKLAGLDRARVWDAHVHVVGSGAGGTGCWASPRTASLFHPWLSLQRDLYEAAGGIVHEERADQEFVERLLSSQRAWNPSGRVVALAFDFAVGEDGAEDRERSLFHVPDAYVLALARAHPEIAPAVSIHPYRTDAVARLRAARAAGAVAVKWLPSAQAIDPASARCDVFYGEAAALGIPLIVHAGAEHAVPGGDAELGNPLRLRRALERGATVIAAHCGSLGELADTDRAGAREAPCFELWERVMDEPGRPGRLLGDLSATAFVNRGTGVLRRLLEREDLHARLVNGSDWPLPAIDPLIRVGRFRAAGLLARDDAGRLSEAFDVNPLAADCLLKRCLRLGDGAGAGRFTRAVFETARVFAPG